MTDMNQVIRDRVRGKGLAAAEPEVDKEPAPQPSFGGRVSGQQAGMPRRTVTTNDRLRAMVARRGQT